MTDQTPSNLPNNALIKMLPKGVQRFMARFFITRSFAWLVSGAFVLWVLATSVWLMLALWIHEPLGAIVTKLFMVFWVCLALSLTGPWRGCLATHGGGQCRQGRCFG